MSGKKEFNSTDLLAVDEKLIALRKERERAVARKLDNEMHLSRLADMYDTVKFESKEFTQIHTQRKKYKEILEEIEIEIRKINSEIKRFKELKADIERFIRDNRPPEHILTTLGNKVDGLIQYYGDFAKDLTRVASTRVMAKEFEDKLRELRKLF